MTECNKVYTSQLRTRSPRSPRFIKRDYIIHNKRWYIKLVKDNNQGLLDYYNLEDLLSHLVVALSKNDGFMYTYFDSYVDFYHYQKKFTQRERHFFEVINFFQKPHFDIDIDFDKLKKYCNDITIDYLHQIGHLLLETIIKGCQIILEPNVLNLQKDVLIYTSHDVHKVSYHIILNNWCHHDHIEAKAFFDQVYNYCEGELKGKYVECIDNSVYKPNQNFRILGSQKCNTNRIKIFQPYFTINNNIINHIDVIYDDVDKQALYHLSKSLITFTSGCQLLQTFYIEKNIIKYNYLITEQDVEEIKKLLHQQFNNMFTIRDVVGYKVFLKRAKPYHCMMCERIHLHENPMILVYNGAVRWTCRRRDDKKTVLLGYLSSATNKDDKQDVSIEEEDNNHLLIFGDYTINLNINNLKPTIVDHVDDKPSGLDMLQSNNIKYKNRQSIRQNKNIVPFNTILNK